MALADLLDLEAFVGGVEFTSVGTSLTVEETAAELDGTTWGSKGWNAPYPGLRASSWQMGGKVDLAAAPNAPDDVLSTGLGGSQVVTATPVAVAEGGRAYTFAGLLTEYHPLDGQNAGELAEWSATWAGQYPLVQATVLSSPRTARSANGTGPAQNLGAIPDGKRLWVAVHAIASSGGTITPRVESDTASGFTSATTQVTGVGITAPGAQWLSVLGPLAGETWWRAAWTVTGGTHRLLIAAGIA